MVADNGNLARVGLKYCECADSAAFATSAVCEKVEQETFEMAGLTLHYCGNM